MEKGLISIRPCKKSDCKFLWNLRNEKTTRETAFNTDYIPYKRHVKWFSEKISDDNSCILIVINRNKRIGQARLDLTSRYDAEVDIGILKTERKKGFGSKAINLVCLYGFRHLGLKRIIAYVKKENTPSFKMFKKYNFSNEGICNIKNKPAYRMVLR